VAEFKALSQNFLEELNKPRNPSNKCLYPGRGSNWAPPKSESLPLLSNGGMLNGKEKPNFLEEILSQSDFVHHIFHMDHPGI
jgi:hypothetical protein